MNGEEHCHVEAINRTPSQEELASLKETILLVRGMGCPNCAMRVRNALIGREGVVQASVDHHSGQALVRHNPSIASVQTLLQAVQSAGNDGRHEYRAVPV